MIFLQLLFIVIQWFLVNNSAEIPAFSDKFQSAIVTGELSDPQLVEASGIAASAINPGYYWIINDSGNSPAIYLIDSLGMVKRQLFLKNADNIDWEDITLVKNPNHNRHQLIIADIGDNFSVRSFIQLIVFDEPTLALQNESYIDVYQCYKYVYEDGARDAEAILSDPVSNEIYIVSKREPQVGVYALPALHQQSAPDTLKLVGRLPFNNITSGSLSPDGQHVVLKNYQAIFYWSRQGNHPLLETLQMPHELINYVVEPQGEAITWNREGSGFYTISERSYADKQVLYFYSKKK